MRLGCSKASSSHQDDDHGHEAEQVGGRARQLAALAAGGGGNMMGFGYGWGELMRPWHPSATATPSRLHQHPAA
jgi:hypothetical protein